MKKAFLLIALMMAFYPFSAMAGGCPGSERDDLPPCCATFTVPSGGSDADRSCVGPATSYIMTIHEFGFKDDGGTRHQFTGAKTFDMASVDAGSNVGSFIQGAALPAGTYTHMTPVISQNIQISANITTADSRTCSGTVTGFDTEEETNSCDSNFLPDACIPGPGNSCQNCIADGKNYLNDNQLGTFTFAPGDSLALSFAFYTESAAKCVFPAGGVGDGTLSVGPLNVRITRN